MLTKTHRGVSAPLRTAELLLAARLDGKQNIESSKEWKQTTCQHTCQPCTDIAVKSYIHSVIVLSSSLQPHGPKGFCSPSLRTEHTEQIRNHSLLPQKSSRKALHTAPTFVPAAPCVIPCRPLAMAQTHPGWLCWFVLLPHR